MSDVVIRSTSLCKRYQLGERVAYGTLREALQESASRPFRALFGAGGNEERSTRAREHVWALRDVSFEVRAGEVLGIIGRNGAGKSTLLKILSRITKPTEGEVEIHGRVGSLLEVGTGFHPELTGRENIFLNGAILGMKRAEIARKFDEIVEFAEVAQFIDTPVKRYSSGMYTRLAFAVAAHLDPDVLVVDEVLAVGDASFQRKCLGKLDALSHDGRTVLFVSHNMNAIQRLCQRALLLERGRIVMDGPAAGVISHYLSDVMTAVSPGAWSSAAGVSRQGTGQVRVQALRYHGGQAAAGDAVVSRGPFNVSLDLIAETETRIGSAAVMLFDQHGTKLINLDTLERGEEFSVGPDGLVLTFHADELNLNPGSYTLGWWLSRLPDVFDWVESAATVEVIESASHRFGARPRNDGIVACPFTVSTAPRDGAEATRRAEMADPAAALERSEV